MSSRRLEAVQAVMLNACEIFRNRIHTKVWQFGASMEGKSVSKPNFELKQ